MSDKMESGLVKPTMFRVKISSCGTNTFNGTYPRWEDKSAILLLQMAVKTLSKDFVGEQHSLSLEYDLACLILSSLNGWEKEKLLESIKPRTDEEYQQYKETLINKWTMKVHK